MVYAQDKQDAKPATSTATTGSDLPVYEGVDSSIKDYLCTPSENPDGHDLERCINRLFRFGITAGALIAVFFIVFTGYLYITGGESAKTKAKQMLYSVFTGMAILLGGYLLLYFINPSLVIFKPIQPPIFDAADLPKCEDIGFGERCVTADGGISFGGMACAMPLSDSVVKGYNNTVHNPWDNDPGTPDKHRTVRQPPNGPPPSGAVDLAVSKPAVPIYSPISGKVDHFGDLKRVGKYITITTDLQGSGCAAASGCASLAHIEPSVKVGDRVTAGQQVGVSTVYEGGLGPHLHLELKLGGQWITGDGKKGTWDNMKAAISKCSSGSSGGGNVPSGFVDATTIVPELQVEMKYATTDNFMKEKLYSDSRCLLLKSTAEKLKVAQEALKKVNKNYRLKVWDCYRPIEVQKKMRDWGDKQKPRIDNQYIASTTGGDHPKGRAVDLTIYDISAKKDLKMPTPFDEFSAAAGTSNDNSKILRKVMVDEAKFVPASKEWWHFANKQ